MSVIPFERKAKPENTAPQRHGFWRRLETAIDSLAAYQVKHALSEQELRRVDGEIVRCRQLMFPKSQHFSTAVPYRLQVDRMRRLRP
jgi:hypothetical protein